MRVLLAHPESGELQLWTTNHPFLPTSCSANAPKVHGLPTPLAGSWKAGRSHNHEVACLAHVTYKKYVH